MLTRNDFVRLAEIVCDMRNLHGHSVANSLTKKLVDFCTSQNPNFDRRKFLEACEAIDLRQIEVFKNNQLVITLPVDANRLIPEAALNTLPYDISLWVNMFAHNDTTQHVLTSRAGDRYSWQWKR